MKKKITYSCRRRRTSRKDNLVEDKVNVTETLGWSRGCVERK